jgi:hypothetical protein
MLVDNTTCLQFSRNVYQPGKLVALLLGGGILGDGKDVFLIK